MYKEYSAEEYLRVTDRCSARIRNILESRYSELEEQRDAINDRYPFEDLYLKQAEVDDEEKLIRLLLKYLASCTEEMKSSKKTELRCDSSISVGIVDDKTIFPANDILTNK